MSVLNSKIEDMQRMSKKAVDESKSIFQNENASLKSGYDHAAKFLCISIFQYFTQSFINACSNMVNLKYKIWKIY